MPVDRITELRVQGLRTLKDIQLNFGGMTVLIGENGSGKSSMIEALELLHLAADGGFIKKLNSIHGGLLNLITHGSSSTTLGITTSGSGEQLQYSFSISRDAQTTFIEKETLQVRRNKRVDDIILRNISESRVIDKNGNSTNRVSHQPDSLVISRFGDDPPHPAISRIQNTLRSISVHVPFDSMAYWAAHDIGRQSSLREAVILERADHLSRFGINLANVYYALKNRPVNHWQQTLDYIRLGLGRDFDDLILETDPAGSKHSFKVKYTGNSKPVLASALSEGQLAYLAIIAMTRIEPDLSLLAMDEVESHLHPHLLMRILDLLESLAEEVPVVLATHSDRLLDGLSKPADSTVICELDDKRSTRLVRPDKALLDKWLDSYSGIGEIRSAGHVNSILKDPDNS